MAGMILLPGVALSCATVGWLQQKAWLAALGCLAGVGLALLTWLMARRITADLRASEAMLDRAGRMAGVGGWELDLPCGEIRWSRQTCRIHDLPPEHRPRLEEALVHYGTEGRRQLQDVIARAAADGTPWDLELPMTTALGRFIWVRIVGEAIEPVRPGAPVTRLIGSIQDVTGKHALEDATRRSNTVLRSVVDNLPCGLSVYDGDLLLVAHNQQFRRLLDLPDHLFEGPSTRFEDLVAFSRQRGDYGEGESAAVMAQRFLAFAREPTGVEFERERRNGTSIEVRAAPMPGGGFITTYVDLTERKRAQAEIARSGELLRGAMDAVDEAFVLFDPQDRLVFCNGKYRSINADIADLLLPGISFEQILQARIARNPRHEAHRHGPRWVAERVAMHQSGDVKMVHRLDDGRYLRVIERRMPDGHIAGFRIDITDLMRATEAAEKASVAKSRFLANMSHEIRTPMNAVLGMLKLLQKTALTTRQRDYAAKTEGAARSLLGLLNDILDFSKVEAGKMSLDAHPMRIDALLRDLSVILAANLGRKNVEVLFDIDPRLPRLVVADAMRLQQVLINLAGNAIKFTEAGEVVVSLQSVTQDAQAVELEIAVRDTGIGIAPEHHERIFAGFNQAEASTTRRFGGTGLGLAISRRLVELMGGELHLESAPGRGSRFHFRLQLAVPPEVMPVPAGVDDAAPALRALLVDDNASAREVLATMAGGLGWEVEVVESGEQALARLHAAAGGGSSPDVVLIDWAMPGMDGWQTSQAIRALEASGIKPPLLVMVTAHGREMLAQRSEQEQGLLDGFLVKPVTASMLHEAVSDARAGGRNAAARLAVEPAVQSGRRLQGLRLLVVEDNLNNRQVVSELLEDEGAEVLLAGDGQQGLSLLAHAKAGARIDAVLMDVQMPVMDGYTATRLIRRQLALSLPVIAMTANALASERQACLDAGMNEHVGKPFDIDHLVAVLLRHCGRTGEASSITRRPAPALPPALSEQARQGGIALEEALGRMSGKTELFERMTSALADTAAALPARLDGPPAAAAAALHGFRGLAAMLGATALASLAGQGERGLQAGEALDADWHARFAQALQRDVPALRMLARQLPAPAPLEPAAPVDLQPALDELAELLAGSDMAALERFAVLRPALAAERPALAESLDAALAVLDFSGAAGQCRAFLRETR